MTRSKQLVAIGVTTGMLMLNAIPAIAGGATSRPNLVMPPQTGMAHTTPQTIPPTPPRPWPLFDKTDRQVVTGIVKDTLQDRPAPYIILHGVFGHPREAR